MIRKIVWLFGLSGAGKTTLSRLVEDKLNVKSIVIDADDIRSTINKDLGFAPHDRYENNRRLAQLALWLDQQGFQVIVTSMLPVGTLRELVTDQIGVYKLQLVWVKCAWGECRKRDPKGLYQKAEDGELENFTGPGNNFEEPYRPEVTINTTGRTEEDCAEHLHRVLFTL